MELGVGVVVVVVVVSWLVRLGLGPFCILTPPLPQPHPAFPLRLRNTIIESILKQYLNVRCSKVLI